MGCNFCSIIFVLYGLGLWVTARGTTYTVGDNAGWDISTDLDSWVAGKSFTVGDVLVFQFSSLHSVSQVNKADFDTCTASNALQSIKTGNATIPLATPGPKYFICGTLSHCLGGMKLQVDVKGGQATAPALGPMADPRPLAEAPSSFPRTNAKSNNNNPLLPGTPSLGPFHSAWDSLPLACFSLLGTFLWLL